MTIWKYELTTITKLTMPIGSKVLSLQVKNNIPCIWALIPDEAAMTEKRIFEFFSTGHDFNDKLGNYIGTVQLEQLVFHLFETT